MGKNRIEDSTIRRIDKESCRIGTNGIGKAFQLRPKPDWKILVCLHVQAKAWKGASAQ